MGIQMGQRNNFYDFQCHCPKKEKLKGFDKFCKKSACQKASLEKQKELKKKFFSTQIYRKIDLV